MDTIKIDGWTYHERTDLVLLRTTGSPKRKKVRHQKKRVYGFRSIFGFCYNGARPNISTSRGRLTFEPQAEESTICDIYMMFTGRV